MATPQKLPSKSLLLPGIAPHLFSSQRRRPRRRPVLNSSAHTKIGSNDSGASIIRSTSSHSSSGSSRTTESIHPSSDESAGTGNRRILEARVAEAERRAADAERRAADAEARAADAEHLANAEARLVHCRARVAAAQGELEELKGQEDALEICLARVRLEAVLGDRITAMEDAGALVTLLQYQMER